MLKRTIWYIAKPGEERAFATPNVPSHAWAESLRKEGYFIFKVIVELPPIFDPSIGELGGTLESSAQENWTVGKEGQDATSADTEEK